MENGAWLVGCQGRVMGGEKHFYPTGYLLGSLLPKLNSTVCTGDINGGSCVDLPLAFSQGWGRLAGMSLTLSAFWKLL